MSEPLNFEFEKSTPSEVVGRLEKTCAVWASIAEAHYRGDGTKADRDIAEEKFDAIEHVARWGYQTMVARQGFVPGPRPPEEHTDKFERKYAQGSDQRAEDQKRAFLEEVPSRGPDFLKTGLDAFILVADMIASGEDVAVLIGEYYARKAYFDVGTYTPYKAKRV